MFMLTFWAHSDCLTFRSYLLLGGGIQRWCCVEQPFDSWGSSVLRAPGWTEVFLRHQSIRQQGWFPTLPMEGVWHLSGLHPFPRGDGGKWGQPWGVLHTWRSSQGHETYSSGISAGWRYLERKSLYCVLNKTDVRVSIYENLLLLIFLTYENNDKIRPI